MRQVPKNLKSSSVLLVGSGRLARHLSHYFELEKISFEKWSRSTQDEAQLMLKLERAEVVLIAISDAAIEDFFGTHQLQLKAKTCIHFSGALHVAGAWGAHPLMSFASELYSLEKYRKIPFVLEEGMPKLNEILPTIKNPISFLAAEKRARYHMLCSMGGNFSVILWEYVIQSFERDLGLSGESLLPYLEQITENLSQFAEEMSEKRKSVLTGPLVRDDLATIEKHLSELKQDAMKPVYEAFVGAYRRIHAQQNHRSIQSSEESIQ